MSPEEQKLRQQVAAATRMLQSQGILGYSGHISVRTGPDTFLLQPRESSRAYLAPEDLLVLNLNGDVVDGPEGVDPPSEKVIHTAILKARPDVGAVFHFHPENATLLTLAEGAELVAMKNHAFRWQSGIPIHPHSGHIKSDADGAALAATLGPHHACLLRAHGAVIVAEDVPSVMIDAVHFEENAEALIKVMTFAKPMPLTDAEAETMAKSSDRPKHVSKLWSYYLGLGQESGVIPAAWNLLN